MVGISCLVVVFLDPAPLARTPPLRGVGSRKSQRYFGGAEARWCENSIMIQHLSGNQLPSHRRGGVAKLGWGNKICVFSKT